MHQHYPKRRQVKDAITCLRHYSINVQQHGKQYRMWQHGYTTTLPAHEILRLAHEFKQGWHRLSKAERKQHIRCSRRQAAKLIPLVDNTTPLPINPTVWAMCCYCAQKYHIPPQSDLYLVALNAQDKEGILHFPDCPCTQRAWEALARHIKDLEAKEWEEWYKRNRHAL